MDVPTEAELWEALAYMVSEARKADALHNGLRYAVRHRDINDLLDRVEVLRLELIP